MAKVRIHFRGAAGEIQRANVMQPQVIQHQLHHGQVHQFGAFGSGIHMAMGAAEIAQIAQVNLQGLRGSTPQAGEIRADSSAGIGLDQKRACIKHGALGMRKWEPVKKTCAAPILCQCVRNYSFQYFLAYLGLSTSGRNQDNAAHVKEIMRNDKCSQALSPLHWTNFYAQAGKKGLYPFSIRRRKYLIL